MAKKLDTNVLYYGDNLHVLRNNIPGESVDLVYLDPPFNSNRSYNVLFKEASKASSPAQIEAFEDTWHWGESAQEAFEEVALHGTDDTARLLKSMVDALGRNDVTAYLSMMAVRLIELRKVLKPNGSIYLHCDPTASHYLKVLLDSIFGASHFRNEIIWKRTMSKGLMTRRLPQSHDVILSYQKSDRGTWNSQAIFSPYDLGDLDEKTAGKYGHRDSDGRLYQLDNLINPNPNRPNLTYEFLGVTKVWRWTKERMQAAYEAGLVVQPKPGAVPRFKRYLDEQRGRPLGDIWADIPPINSQAKERLGYPTQKPLALLERIVEESSNPGDIVLDPFCGCGTAIHAAQKLGRKWIGIDITHLAIGLVRRRMEDAFPELKAKIKVIGEPVDLPGATELAARDPYQFQWWALDRIGASPAGGERKKGMDRGIDGIIPFVEEKTDRRRVIVSVKAGKLSPTFVRDLKGVLDREGEPIGVLVTLNAPTREMKTEAVAGGSYHSDRWGLDYPRLQILTAADLLDGKQVKMPPQVSLFAQAPTEQEVPETPRLL